MARVLGTMMAAGVMLVAGFSGCVSGSDEPAASSPSPHSGDSLEQPPKSRAAARGSDSMPATAATRSWLQRIERWAEAAPLLHELLAPRDGLLGLAPGVGPGTVQSRAYRLAAAASAGQAVFVTTGERAGSELEVSMAPRSELGLRMDRGETRRA
jgi:hypothetical protein